MKRRNQLFSIGTFLILILIPVYMIFIKNPNVISLIENRYLTTFDKLSETSFFDGSFQSTLADAMRDQFMLRYKMTEVKQQSELYSTKVVDKLLHREISDYSLSFVSGTPVCQVGNSNYLMNYVMEYDSVIESRILGRIDEINQFKKDFSDVNVVVYHPTQIHEVGFFDDANGIESAGEYYNQLFIDHLEVPYDYLRINNIEDYYENFYSSDHHWNDKGAYKGYQQIADLLHIEALVPEKEVCNDANVFNGTFSTRTSYAYPGASMCAFYYKDLIKADVSSISSDYGSDVDMNVLDNDLYHVENVENTNDFALKNEGVLSESYYYNDAYNVYGPLSVFDSHQSDLPSILVVGDSYSRPIIQLLASSYNKIYQVNAREYYILTHKEFDFYRFMEEYPVKDVLFMYTIENYFYDGQYEWFAMHNLGD